MSDGRPELMDRLLTRSNWLAGLVARQETITNPWVGKDVARFGRIRFNLLPQVSNEYPKILGLIGVATTPNISQ